MDDLFEPIESNFEETDKILGFHIEITGDDHGNEILREIANEHFKNNSDESLSKECEGYEEYEQYSDAKCCKGFDDKQNLLWVLLYTSEGVMHFFCNDLVFGNALMIETLFSNIKTFYTYKRHFNIKQIIGL